MRTTPCESTPRRFAHTTASAQRAAISGATPAAAKIAAAKQVRSDLLRRMSSLMRQRLAEPNERVEHAAGAPSPLPLSSPSPPLGERVGVRGSLDHQLGCTLR